ncbi:MULTISPECIES: NepR family anti-sigma factor [Rhodomicrobium]|uniref:NepR family anti-sigma factor n=1 Tax=Rhodomicrobium TaxID=1068 RepID=UPI000B4BD209|nr:MULTISPECIES: NepR family anti-sigma factor [Rhodomicrobium]
MMMSDTEEHKGIRLKAGQSAKSRQSEHSAELGEQVIVQLKTSYDKLLHEPLPDHLLQLLNELKCQEDRS